MPSQKTNPRPGQRSAALQRLVNRLCDRFGAGEVERILLEMEEKAESYRGKTSALSVGHEDEYAGG